MKLATALLSAAFAEARPAAWDAVRDGAAVATADKATAAGNANHDGAAVVGPRVRRYRPLAPRLRSPPSPPFA